MNNIINDLHQELQKLGNIDVVESKKKFFKKEELKIRQSIGEAVPTIIFQQIAYNIKNSLENFDKQV